MGEDLPGIVELNELPGLARGLEVEEAGLLGNPRGLLHVVRDDDDRVLVLELGHEVLDRQRRDRVEGRAGLVHEEDGRAHGDRAGDAQALLLAARKGRPRLVEAILHLVPQVRPAQRLLDELLRIRLLELAGIEGDAREDVLGDRHRREGVGALEHHSDVAADLDGIDVLRVNVLAFEEDPALDAGARDRLVHAVEGPEESRLPAARRADERRDRARRDLDGDVVDGEEVAVEDLLVRDVDELRHEMSLE